MFLHSLLIVTASVVPLSSDVEISPTVRALVTRYGKTFGPDAERDLERLSLNGDRTAAALLGELLQFQNRAGGQDFAKSCNYSEAAGRHASALHNLATCYFNGTGRPRDLKRARDLYGQAADMGFAKAACALGNMLTAGTGGPAEPQRGVELCKRAADTGLPDAQTDYAGYLLTNRFIAKDAVAARRYLSLAAAKGHPNASFLLGQIYWNGDGIEKNTKEAAKWWSIAYNGGRLDAARLLGVAMLAQILPDIQSKRPIRVSDLEQARAWFAIAVEKDPDPAERRKATEMLANLKSFKPVASDSNLPQRR